MKEGTKPTGPPKPVKGMKATLYLGGNIVTTKMNEQIQLLASQTTKMMAYVAEKFDWTDDQTKTTVNWKSKTSIRFIQIDTCLKNDVRMMVEHWQTKEEARGGDYLCPCCGSEEEDGGPTSSLSLQEYRDARHVENIHIHAHFKTR